jgi:DNA repair exonuclease SbcCD ATPase subunit
MISENGKDSEEVMDMQCGQPIEWETDGISESRGEHPTSTDKNGTDNPTDVQTIMLCMKEMFREIREENEKIREEFRTENEKMSEEYRKENEKRAKEWNERLESIFVIHERGILSSLNQTAREVELKTDRMIEAVNKEIRQITESTEVQFRALTEKVQSDKTEITNDFEILRQEMTVSHAQLNKRSENGCERVNQFEKRMTEVELVNRHMNEQYEEVRTQIERLKNKEIVKNRNNTGEVQRMRSNNRQSDSRRKYSYE